jgi:DNA-directed RNA polymerase
MTPWFTARFPKLSQPDTDGKYADGKFKVDAIFEDKDLVEIEKVLKDAGKSFFPGEANVQLPLKTYYGNAEDKKAKKDPVGKGLTMKSKNKPLAIDGKKQKLPDGVVIGGGSILRAACALAPYTKTEKVRNADGSYSEEEIHGVTLYVNTVQVRKLVEYQNGADAFAEDPEGFTYQGATEGAEQFSDATSL